jgi:ATP-dependent DNA helicase RecG
LNDLLTVIKKSPGLKSPQLAKMLDKGQSTVERYLKILKDKSLINFKGALKTGGYFLNFDQESMDEKI